MNCEHRAFRDRHHSGVQRSPTGSSRVSLRWPSSATRFGAPLAADAFEILVFANNCTDGTSGRQTFLADSVPQRVVVIEEELPVGDGQRRLGAEACNGPCRPTASMRSARAV